MEKIIVVCPKCGREMEIPGERKNTRIECSSCGVFFMAYEAVKCENCGRFRHPNHPCKCLSRTPEKIVVMCPRCGTTARVAGRLKNTRIECFACGGYFMAYEAVKCGNCGRFRHPNHPCKCESQAAARSAFEKKTEEEEAKERAAEVAFRSLPENIQTVFEHEAAKYEKLLAEMRERIEALESAVTDLEAEIEELREE